MRLVSFDAGSTNCQVRAWENGSAADCRTALLSHKVLALLWAQPGGNAPGRRPAARLQRRLWLYVGDDDGAADWLVEPGLASESRPHCCPRSLVVGEAAGRVRPGFGSDEGRRSPRIAVLLGPFHLSGDLLSRLYASSRLLFIDGQVTGTSVY